MRSGTINRAMVVQCCTIHCTGLRPLSRIRTSNPYQSTSILLKTLHPQSEDRIRSQTLYPAELRARRNANAVKIDYDREPRSSTR
jgi:hypothetical protein